MVVQFAGKALTLRVLGHDQVPGKFVQAFEAEAQRRLLLPQRGSPLCLRSAISSVSCALARVKSAIRSVRWRRESESSVIVLEETRTS